MHKIWYERETSDQTDAQTAQGTMQKESTKRRK